MTTESGVEMTTETAALAEAVMNTARLAAASGIVVLPAKKDGSKYPALRTWREFEHRRPSREELRSWFAEREQDGLGFICGAVSGGLEMFEFEHQADYEAFLELAASTSLGEVVDRIRDGYEETTPGGGVHLIYRCEEVRGSKKLASKVCPGPPACTKHEAGRPHVLVETRGDGGWVVVAPSGGSTHLTGRPYELTRGGISTITTLTPEERDELWRLARTLDQMPVREDAPPPRHEPHEADGTRPGDLFNAQAGWDEVLAPHGWKRLFQRGHLTYWRRPGKDHGVSATTGVRNAADPSSDLLWVFSTSTEFEAEAGYSKWRAYAVLNTGGDFAAAARDLKAQGYSEPDIGPLVAPAAPASFEDPQPAPERPQEPPEPPYAFESVFPPDHFIGRYVAYASQRTDAPHEYHEAIACLLLGAATPGVRARLSAWPNGLATNLYVVLVGESTKSRKSTAINEGKRMLRTLEELRIPPPVFPDWFSDAALLEQLAMRTASPSVWCPDELGQVLEDIERRSQLKDALLSLYDSPPSYDNARHSKRVKGEAEVHEDVDRVQKPHWNILGATTEAVFDSLSTRTVQSGLLPRFAFVYPHGHPPRMGLRESTPSMEGEFSNLAYYLKQLARWAQTVREVDVTFAPGTIEALDRFMVEVEDTGLTIVARLPATAVKLAMLSALGEEIPAVPRVVVELRDVERAVSLARKWMRYAMRFGTEIGGFDIHERKFQQRIAKVITFLKANGGRASKREIFKHLNISKKDLDELQVTLIDRGDIEVVKGESSGGRPPEFWVSAS